MIALFYLATLAFAIIRRRYWMWTVWLGIWTAVMLTWAPQDRAWVAAIWMPGSIGATLFLALAGIEAFMMHAGPSGLASTLSFSLGAIAASAGILVFQYAPGTAISQTSAVNLSFSVGTAVFLVLSVAFWASVGRCRWCCGEFRHMLVVAGIALTFAVPRMTMAYSAHVADGVLLAGLSHHAWYAMDGVIQWARCGLLLTWLIAVQRSPSERPSALVQCRGDLAALQSCSPQQRVASPHRS